MATKAKQRASALPIEHGMLRATNAEIMNTVRQYAPDDYKSRIPPATQGNVAATLKALNAYQNDWNVFWDVLHNRIGMTMVRQRGFENPLSVARRISMQYGTTIQEIQVNLLRAKDYDKDAINVFGLDGREPDIHQQFHTMNSRLKYEIVTPMADVLRGAFTNETDLSALINAIYATPYDSMENDEYLQQVDLFAKYQQNEGFYNVHVDAIDPAATSDDAAEAGRKLTRAVRAFNTKLRFYSQDYSAEGRQAGLSTLSRGTYLVTTADVDASLTVDMLAYMFNEQDGRLLADRVVVLPKFPGELSGCQALLLEDDFLLTADNLPPTMLPAPINPVNMTQLRVLHVWRTLSYSRFANAIMFSTLPDTTVTRLDSTVTGVTLLDAESHAESTIETTVDANGYPHTPAVELVATVQGTNGPSQAVQFTVEGYDGKGKAWGLPADCFVDSKGTFHAGHTPAGTVVVVKATSIQNPAFSATYTVTVEGAEYVTAVNVDKQSVTVNEGDSETVTVSFTPANPTDDGFTAALAVGTHAMIQVDHAAHTVQVTGVSQGTDTLVITATGSDSGVNVVKTVPVTVNASA